MEKQYLNTSEACKLLNLSRCTVNKHADLGLIQTFRTAGNQRRFIRSSIQDFINKRELGQIKEQEHQAKIKNHKKYAYARISSRKQQDDLKRQVEFLQEKYPEYEVLSDIGSGINFKRKNFLRILEEACSGTQISLAIAHKDRLSRFAFDLIKFIIERTGGEIIVQDDTLGDNSVGKSDEQELSEDLLSIVHIFNCRQMGKRRYSKPKISPQIEPGETQVLDQEDTPVTHEGTENHS
jgi:excisionase family DNA binding protein